eukprot:CAMPEP_0194299158 /NCGR_PEP_ID=MMETSP0169-20130528/60564_1 /TAXON_ID=218684 /ORGANISM="Corethron pennatum, Strain L29A3" /LENGTH=1505 /DNA_ID=CAMNT_0039049229 /DNA_START=234 /DNA_END=4748 /DNA_ORIENTATION=-
MAAALLAIDDFNTRNATVIPELDDEIYRQCSVYVPENGFEVYDHDASVEGLVPKTLLGKSSTCSSPCAIVGPYTDEFAVKLSAIAEAWGGIPLITHGAEIPVLSGLQYPTVFRSNVDFHAMAEAIIQFLKSKGRKVYLGGIYEGKFGTDWRQAMENAAKEAGFELERFKTSKISPPYKEFSPKIAMEELKSYRTIFLALMDPLKLFEFADVAQSEGMNVGDHVYIIIIPNHFELDEILLQAKSRPNLGKLMNGAALVRVIDSFIYKPILGTNDTFREHWRAQNASLVDRINVINPIDREDKRYFVAPDTYFQAHKPLRGSSFMYDAVMIALMGKCQEELRGSNHTNSFVKAIESLKFTGATGTVKFQENRRRARNRNRHSVAYGVYNFRSANHTLKYYLTDIITNGSVNGTITESSDGPFQFANGTSIPPDFEYDPNERNSHYISEFAKSVNLLVVIFCLLSNFLCAMLVSFCSKKAPIQDAQPCLLYLLLIGSTAMVMSVFLQRFDDRSDDSKLNELCMASPWLLVVGFIMTQTAFLSKLFTIKRISKISAMDYSLMTLCGLVMISMITVLLVFTRKGGFKWIRTITDPVTLSSYACCEIDGSVDGSEWYMGVLQTLSFILLICLAYMAFDIKKSDKCADARWISYAILSYLQISIITFLLITPPEKTIDPNSNFLVRSIFMFIINSFTIGLMFIPKVYNLFFSNFKMSDSVWIISFSDLHFDDPAEVIGRGTFGSVLLAEYRGTNVAVKRVIPPQKKSKVGSSKIDMTTSFENNPSKQDSASKQDAASTSATLSLRMMSGSSKARNEYAKLKADFILEMRALSKLRHPNITTIMGAIVTKNEEPMMIMEYMDHGSLYDVLHNETMVLEGEIILMMIMEYMDHGSLYDVLHNETMVLEGEIILPILCNIAKGLRFLHAAEPSVIHCDLKAANVLIDSRFRAKVSDFGLSQKRQVNATDNKKNGVTGTPYWMAPELLSHQSSNGTATDVYSFGVILYEVYSRKDPYEGEFFSEVIKMVIDPNICKRPLVPESCPEQVRAIMNECLKHDSKQRPNFADLDVRLKNLDVDKVDPIKTFQEKKRTDKLLYDVFPRHIADSLRDGRKIDAEVHNVVTIFFSDIVGFTNISNTLEPIKISLMLDRLYHSFDQISRKHDVFKVETIGDAYMAVCNLVNEQPDHAKRIADFSVDVLRAASATPIDLDDPERGCVSIRIGFHSGPVVANVVGSRNPRYCLFGDTVNTASRMESSSIVNRIHCSERAASFLREQNPKMPIRSRGVISVKGKGEMHTYWINEDSDNKSVVNKNEICDRLYHSFDQISRKHDVFKVETIGDAYMAVCNLVNEQPDHTKRIADFSVDVLRAASATPIDLDDPERGCVNIRIGFHSGPVVSNVVGSRNPRYCLFGDTVNTASRMESSSIENRIHCSERAANFLKEQNPKMPIQSRGCINVKGKGEMHHTGLTKVQEILFVEIASHLLEASIAPGRDHKSAKSVVDLIENDSIPLKTNK